MVGVTAVDNAQAGEGAVQEVRRIEQSCIREIVVSRVVIHDIRLPADGRTSITVGGPKADAWIAKLQKRVNHPPKDATFAVRPGGIEVVADRPGRALDVAAGVAAIEKAIFSEQSRTAVLPLEIAEASRSNLSICRISDW